MNMQISREAEFRKSIGNLLAEYPEMREKYGLFAVHHHFPLAAGEVLHETSDAALRMSRVTPVNVESLPSGSRPTMWTFEPNGEMLVHQWCCDASG